MIAANCAARHRGIWDRNPLGRPPFFRNAALPLAYVD
jgi:hypothetical protein